MSRKKLFDNLIVQTQNDEITFNLFLVSCGGRKATLLEAADYKHENFDNFVNVATNSLPTQTTCTNCFFHKITSVI